MLFRECRTPGRDLGFLLGTELYRLFGVGDRRIPSGALRSEVYAERAALLRGFDDVAFRCCGVVVSGWWRVRSLGADLDTGTGGLVVHPFVRAEGLRTQQTGDELLRRFEGGQSGSRNSRSNGSVRRACSAQVGSAGLAGWGEAAF
jgi:hypothetical protein